MKINNIFSFLKKHWFIIGLVLVLVSTVSIVVWSRYVDANNSMKRTIVAMAESEEKRFTSNLLTRTESPSPSTYPVSEGTKTTIGNQDYYKLQVIVRNYTPTDTHHYYDENIQYTFTAELTNVGGNPITDPAKAAMILYGDSGENSFTLSNSKYIMQTDTFTLENDSDGPHDKVYTFYFHESLLDSADNVFIKIAATPTNPTIATDVGSLQGIIGISRQATEIVKTWSGYFSDEGAATVENSHTIEASQYDGFNYIIQGNGARTVSLTWDHTVLELNPFSISEITSVSESIDSGFTVSLVESGNNTTLTFKVDSEECTRYDIQFYMKGTELSTWSSVDSYVTFNPNVA